MNEQQLRQRIIERIESMIGIFDDGMEALSTRRLFWLQHYLANGNVASEINIKISRAIEIQLHNAGVQV